MNIYRNYTREQLDAEYNNRGKVDDFEAHAAFWPSRSSALRAEGRNRLDVAYGPSPDEKLDIFTVEGPRAPIQFFIHGGYWHLLSKNEFSFVARPFRRRGAITIVIDYALMPGVDMHELVRQCRAALAWTWKNADSFGGDRERIHVSGHSAGGHLVAMLCATDWRGFDGDLPADPIASATSISGLMDLEPISLCFLNQTLALDERAVRDNSPVRLQRRTRCPLLLVLGGKEGDEYLRQSESLVRHWAETGPPPGLQVLDGDDHFTIVEQLDDPGSMVSRLLLRQMNLAPDAA